MLFDPIWLVFIVPGVIGTAWSGYQHWRLTTIKRIAEEAHAAVREAEPLALKSLGHVVEQHALLSDQVKHLDNLRNEMHEWHIGSEETTNGKSITTYRCGRCDPAHVERRERR